MCKRAYARDEFAEVFLQKTTNVEKHGYISS
jgi:hypothetical protein